MFHMMFRFFRFINFYNKVTISSENYFKERKIARSNIHSQTFNLKIAVELDVRVKIRLGNRLCNKPAKVLCLFETN